MGKGFHNSDGMDFDQLVWESPTTAKSIDVSPGTTNYGLSGLLNSNLYNLGQKVSREDIDCTQRTLNAKNTSQSKFSSSQVRFLVQLNP